MGLFPELTRNTLAFLFPSSCICASLFASLLFGTFSFTLSRSFFSLVLPPTCLTFLLPALPLLLFPVSCQAGTAWVVSWVGGGRSRQSLSASVPLVAFARLFRCCDIYTNQRVRSGVRSQCGWWVVYAVCVRVHACMRACASTHACVSPPLWPPAFRASCHPHHHLLPRQRRRCTRSVCTHKSIPTKYRGVLADM